MKLDSLPRLTKENIFLGIILLGCFFASLRILQSASFIQENHYVGLAVSLLHSKFDINPAQYSAVGDSAFFNNKYYVYFGPAPAILLLPFVLLFGTAISQQIISILLFLLDFYLIYKIARSCQITISDSLWLVIFFMFGSIFFVTSLINITAYQVQFIATSFFLFALYEFFHKKRWFLIGILTALAATTRSTFYLASVFFLLEMLQANEHLKKKLTHLMLFFLPILISFLIIGYYNQTRFNNFLDFGYTYNFSLVKELSTAASRGFFSLEHIPGNLYFLLFKGPDPIRSNDLNFILKFPYFKTNPWGMGIFFTSPLFLYILLVKIKDKYILSCLITILLILMTTLSYYGSGVWQYGYRYALDFYPLLFLVLLSVFKNGLSKVAKFLIIYGVIFNFFFALSVWGIYPFIA